MTYRQIPPEEWDRLRGIFEQNGSALPAAERNSAVIAEADGQIVGLHGLHLIAHAGPLWVAPEWRGKGISDGMDREVQKVVREAGLGAYFMFPSNEYSEAAVRRFGLKEMGCKVFSREV